MLHQLLLCLLQRKKPTTELVVITHFLFWIIKNINLIFIEFCFYIKSTIKWLIRCLEIWILKWSDFFVFIENAILDPPTTPHPPSPLHPNPMWIYELVEPVNFNFQIVLLNFFFLFVIFFSRNCESRLGGKRSDKWKRSGRTKQGGENNLQGERNKAQDSLPHEEGKEAANEVEKHELRTYVFIIFIKLRLFYVMF